MIELRSWGAGQTTKIEGGKLGRNLRDLAGCFVGAQGKPGTARYMNLPARNDFPTRRPIFQLREKKTRWCGFFDGGQALTAASGPWRDAATFRPHTRFNADPPHEHEQIMSLPRA